MAGSRARTRAALDRAPDAAHRATGLRARRGVEGQGRAGGGLWPCESRARRAAHVAPSVPRRIAFEDVHRRGRAQALRRAPHAPRRSDRHARRRPAASHRVRHHRSTAGARRGTARDGSDTGHWYDRAPFPDEAPLARCARRGPRDRARHALQVLESRLRAPRPRHRGAQRRALRRLDGARGHLGGGPRGDGARHAASARPNARARAWREAAARSSRGRAGCERDAGARGGDGLRLHRVRPRAVLREPRVEARNRWLSAASRRAMLRRLWRDTQSASERWYGLGTISGALAGWDWFGHSGAFQGTITRSICVPSQVALDLGAHQCGRRGGPCLARRHRAHPRRARAHGAPRAPPPHGAGAGGRRGARSISCRRARACSSRTPRSAIRSSTRRS